MTSRIRSIESELSTHEKLLEKRLSSQFHQQWALAESTTNKTKQLQVAIVALETERNTVERDYSKTDLTMTQSINALAQ